MQFDIKKYITKPVVAVSGLVVGSALVYKTIIHWRQQRDSHAVRQSLRSATQQALTTLRQKTGHVQDDRIVTLGFEELREALQNDTLSAKEVLRAYQGKALEVHDKTNCLTDVIREADELVDELDLIVGKKGALHGIPVSIKDSIPIKNYQFHCGCISLAHDECEEDPVFLRMLLREGAVPFLRTSVPQLCMSHETSNPIHGVVTNPHDDKRTPGGSSGGEAALVSGGGSLLGIGTDIGGSIRGPCAFCGVCGLKPGVSRISDVTGYPPWGQTVILPTMGPIAREVDGVVALMRCMLVPEMYDEDPLIPRLPFREDVYQSKRPLIIGCFVDDGNNPVVPAIVRAIKEAEEALVTAGHTLVHWQPPKLQGNLVATFFKGLHGDAGADFTDDLEGDIVDDTIAALYSHLNTNRFVRWLKTIYLRFKGNDKYADFIQSLAGVDSVSDWWAYTAEIEQYRRDFSCSWKASGLDAIICPASVTAASKTGWAENLMRINSYLYLFNILDIPAGVVPVSRVNADDIRGLVNYGADEELAEWVKADQEDTEGLPVGVQVATLRWQEETCLRVMKDIETGVKYM